MPYVRHNTSQNGDSGTQQRILSPLSTNERFVKMTAD